jgi:Phage tail assembly chaperone protein
MLYSLNGAYPAPLPNRIRLSNGNTRTKPSTFTAEEIADAGYVEVPEPPSINYPEVLDWTGTAWVVRQPNQSEIDALWIRVRAECVRLLSESDYQVIKAYEAQQPVPTEWVNYRQALRDIYNNVNNLDPYFITWPDQPE